MFLYFVQNYLLYKDFKAKYYGKFPLRIFNIFDYTQKNILCLNEISGSPFLFKLKK